MTLCKNYYTLLTLLLTFVAGAIVVNHGVQVFWENDHVRLAAWMISLTEEYHSTRLVPSVYLYLIFWSCLMVNVLAQLAGVVLGYRRQ